MPAHDTTALRTAFVTGSSRGIGKALAQALLDRGINVYISSSDGEDARHTARHLHQDRARAEGGACDVTSADAVRAAWDDACERFGGIDIWINNAGLALGGGLVDMPETEVSRMLDINVMGLVHGCQTAIRGWRAAGRQGALYNMLGAGADGTLMPFMNGYATTKAAVTYLTRSLAEEMKHSPSLAHPIVVGAISPGLVITEGFLREHAKLDAEGARARRDWVNLIADHPETIGRWAARIVDTNTRNGRIFTWLTPRKIRDRRKGKPRDVLARYFPVEPS
ncbi:SDR family oxidoreductase [Novosphingobium sp. fls2-241-R2A-195]|jgi:NAD(P)-dependent dehydrogenase (short-subunit alcohol dehydrogenase family)|uniref:SDR family oxidoreductase n=1 Tax=Novosphingobium sp. fls2-241-R2A-195 TaxID=3040296 RepID=UPI00254AA58E|nr:SDR family oxidoreductase [Novosphingobium sp. fls2-241-R2A-195]